MLHKEVTFQKGEDSEFKSVVKTLLSKDKSKVKNNVYFFNKLQAINA